MRGGPGLGNIAPEQGDYHQMVKGGGHSNYRNLVLAPASVQEMAEHTMLAFELADRYRNPAVVLADGCIGQMMEPLHLEERELTVPEKPWAVHGNAATRKNLITSIFLSNDELEAHQQKLEAKYQQAALRECRSESYRTEDAEVLLVGYGIVARVLRSAVDEARQHGLKVGLFRPISLWPFPGKQLLQCGAPSTLLTVELSNGQMVDDVRLAVNGRRPVEFYGRTGGNIPSVEEILDQVAKVYAVA